MEKKVTVERAKEAKQDLERAIIRAIDGFVCDTGLMVFDLVLTRHLAKDGSGAVTAACFEVSAKVEL